MTERLRVSFACNDPEFGQFDGVLRAVEFYSRGDCEASLVHSGVLFADEPDDVPGCPRLEWITTEGMTSHVAVRVGGVGLTTQTVGYYPWEGNICWTAVDMDLDDARALLDWLLAHGFDVDEYALEGPLSELIERRVNQS